MFMFYCVYDNNGCDIIVKYKEIKPYINKKITEEDLKKEFRYGFSGGFVIGTLIISIIFLIKEYIWM